MLNTGLAAAQKKCVIIAIGGAKEWGTLLPGFDTDVSINVHNDALKFAGLSGCAIESVQNQTPEEFREFIKKMGKKYGDGNTNVHLTFTDHGAPSGKNDLEGTIYTGKAGHYKNSAFMDLLKESFQAGTRLTFSNNSCWPSVSGAVIESNLDKHFDICGTASTDRLNMSYNSAYTEIIDNNYYGPFLGVAFRSDLDKKLKEKKHSSVYEFQTNGRKGDEGNLLRFPGYSTSMVYADKVLMDKKINSPLRINPLSFLTNEKYDIAHFKYLLESTNFDDEVLRIKKSFDNAQAGMVQDCIYQKGNHYNSFLKDFSKILASIHNTQSHDLPSPYKETTLASQQWLSKNYNQLKNLMIEEAKFRNMFIMKNRAKIKNMNRDPELYAKVLASWNAQKSTFNRKFFDFAFHIRNIQEAETMNIFYKNANEEQKKRMKNFLECEQKPIL